MLMLRSIALAINLNKEQEKTTFHVFFVLSTWPVSPSGIQCTLLLPLMLLTTAKKKTLLICVYSHGIAGLTDK